MVAGRNTTLRGKGTLKPSMYWIQSPTTAMAQPTISSRKVSSGSMLIWPCAWRKRTRALPKVSPPVMAPCTALWQNCSVHASDTPSALHAYCTATCAQRRYSSGSERSKTGSSTTETERTRKSPMLFPSATVFAKRKRTTITAPSSPWQSPASALCTTCGSTVRMASVALRTKSSAAVIWSTSAVPSPSASTASSFLLAASNARHASRRFAAHFPRRFHAPDTRNASKTATSAAKCPAKRHTKSPAAIAALCGGSCAHSRCAPATARAACGYATATARTRAFAAGRARSIAAPTDAGACCAAPSSSRSIRWLAVLLAVAAAAAGRCCLSASILQRCCLPVEKFSKAMSATTTTTAAAAVGPRRVVWKTDHWMKCSVVYQQLVNLVANNLQIARAIGEVADPADVDSLARVLVSVLHRSGRVLPLIRQLIRDEMERSRSASMKHSALRGNTLASQVEKSFVRLIGKEFLWSVLGDLVRSVVGDPDLDLEIDPGRIVANPEVLQLYGQTVEGIVAKRTAVLENLVVTLVSRITDDAMLARMPLELRAIAAHHAATARELMPDLERQMVSGFLVLRVFSPAIVTPEIVGIIPSDVPPSPRARRNLILIAKVLQNIANSGTPLPSKELYMAPLKPFVDSLYPSLQAYYDKLSAQPQQQPQPPQPATPDETPSEPINVDIREINILDLFELHRILDACSAKLLAKYTPRAVTPVFKPATHPAHPPQHQQWMAATTPSSRAQQHPQQQQQQPQSSPPSQPSTTPPPTSPPLAPSTPTGSGGWVQAGTNLRWRKQFTDLLEQMGPAPTFGACRTETKDEAAMPAVPVSSATAAAAETDPNALERARFLYQGPSTPKGEAVFYLIVNRVNMIFLQNVNPLIAHIYRIMEAAVNAGPFILIVDMSWVQLSTDAKRLIYNQIMSIWKLLSRNYKKNVQQIYVVNPDTFVTTVVFLLKTFVSRKLWRKVTELYDWKQLPEKLGLRPELIALPDASKDSVTHFYKLIKINAHGKRQGRLIKFTLDSLLNIDPKGRKIKNEKLLCDIEEIVAVAGSLELHMRFKPESADLPRGFSPFINEEDCFSRSYVCNSLHERDRILQDIFIGGFRSGMGHSQQEFHVVKVNRAGKHQERRFKLTVDSLMNVAGREIRHEVSFAGIDDVRLDTSLREVCWLKYKAESQWRKIICPDAEKLVQALKEGIRAYRTDVLDATFTAAAAAAAASSAIV